MVTSHFCIWGRLLLSEGESTLTLIQEAPFFIGTVLLNLASVFITSVLTGFRFNAQPLLNTERESTTAEWSQTRVVFVCRRPVDTKTVNQLARGSRKEPLATGPVETMAPC